MSNPQYPITTSTHPELSPVNSVGPVVSGTKSIIREIIFNQPAPIKKDPRKVIEAGKTTPIEVYQQRADEALLKKAA